MVPLWTANDLIEGCDGKLFDTNCEPSPITGIQIDSRACAPGDLFVALPGTAKDGHDFIKDAETANASACLVSRPSSETKIAQVVVDDSLRGLNRLAKKARARFRGKMVGITGSVGKTGCKEMLFHLLSKFGLTHANKDSFNNHIGVPLSLAALPLNHDFAVQEMGMNAPGEIATLTRIVEPSIAFITRIANTHSGFFETLDGIALAKSEIFQGLKSGGIAVLNKDDKFYEKLRNLALDSGASKVINFGRDKTSHLRLVETNKSCQGMNIQADIFGKRVSFELSMHGDHWAINSIGVLACLEALGLSSEKATKFLNDCKTPIGRGERYFGKYYGQNITVINDSYNASPASMTAAFESMRDSPPNVMVISEMLELGVNSKAEHEALIDQINKLSPRLVIGLGKEFHSILKKLNKTIDISAANSITEAVTAFQNSVRDGDSLFVKGSLGSGSWRVCSAVLEELKSQKNLDEGENSHVS